MVDKSKVDLACGSQKRDGFFGIDIVETKDTDLVYDLNIYPWPLESESVEEAYCSHYIEHIPHDVSVKNSLINANSFEDFKNNYDKDSKLDGFVRFINELYRIMKKGSKATIVAPYYTSVRAFGDPTHTRYIGDFSLYYLNKEWRDLNNLSHYGIVADFDIHYSYHINDEMSLRSEEYRNKAFKEDWNAISDIIIELTKR